MIFGIYSVALFILAVIPPVGLTLQGAGVIIKIHHIAGFAVHTMLGWFYWAGQTPDSRYRPWFAPASSFSLGAIIEFVQIFLPYRTGRAGDLLQNALGIALGQGLLYLALAKGWVPGWVLGDFPSRSKTRPEE